MKTTKTVIFVFVLAIWNISLFAQFNTLGSNLYFNTGKVGIGTSSPASTLHLSTNNPTLRFEDVGGADIYSFINNSSGTDVLNFAVYNNSDGRAEMSFDGTGDVHILNGNLGIGTSSPSALLHTTGNLRFDGLSNDNNAARLLGTNASGDVFWIDASGFGSGSTNNCTTTNFITKTDNTGALTCSQLFDDGTNVGLGLTTPQTLFHIGTSSGFGNNGGVSSTNVAPLGTPELLVVGSVKSGDQTDEYTVAEFRSSEEHSSSVGIRIRGSRNTYSYLDVARLDFAIYDYEITSNNGDPGEYNLARMSADMENEASMTGCFRVKTNDGSDLSQAAYFAAGGNVGLGPLSVFDNGNPTTTGVLPIYKLYVWGDVGIQDVPQDNEVEQIVVWDNSTHQLKYREASSLESSDHDWYRANHTSTNVSPSSISQDVYTNGQVGIGLNNPSYPLQVNGAVKTDLSLIASDRRYKNNIVQVDNALEKIEQLQGVTYSYNHQEFPDKNFVDGTSYGFIAQELNEVLPELTSLDEEGYYSVNYDGVVPVLVEAMKEQQEIIRQLESRLSALEGNSLGNSESSDSEKTGSVLYQSHPNPSSENAQIDYEVAESAYAAQLIIFDMRGIQIESFNISGTGSITIQKSEFEAGIYLYSLLVDGKEIDTKKMILVD